MGARLISVFAMTVEDPDQSDEHAVDSAPWSFDVVVPPVSVVEQLDELLSGADEERRNLAARVFSDPDVVQAAGDTDLQDTAAVLNNAALRDQLMAKFSPELFASMGVDSSMALKAQTAALVAPYCRPPRGLTDNDGQALSWDAIREVNEPYAVAVMHAAAIEVYERTKGTRGASAAKNSGSSSQS